MPRYVAKQELVWGDRRILPGEDVPGDDPHRDYAGMLGRGEIADLDAQVARRLLPEDAHERVGELAGEVGRLRALIEERIPHPDDLPTAELIQGEALHAGPDLGEAVDALKAAVAEIVGAVAVVGSEVLKVKEMLARLPAPAEPTAPPAAKVAAKAAEPAKK